MGAVSPTVAPTDSLARAIELRGDAIQKVNHAYGTNGVITEVEMPLAPAHAWVDLMVGSDWRRHAVAEVNAFGDLLPRVLDGAGRDTYTAQVSALRDGRYAGWRAAAGPRPRGSVGAAA